MSWIFGRKWTDHASKKLWLHDHFATDLEMSAFGDKLSVFLRACLCLPTVLRTNAGSAVAVVRVATMLLICSIERC
jgi:hypothetical protein